MSDTFAALQTKSPELARMLQGLAPNTLRLVALKSAAKALYITKPADAKAIQQALEYAEAEDYNHPESVEALRDLANQIEAPYEQALDAAKPVHNDPKLMELFAQARAVIALSLAIDADIEKQAGNAIYEALHAGLPEEDVKRFIESLR